MFGAPLVLLFMANLAGSVFSQATVWKGVTVRTAGALQPHLAIQMVSSAAGVVTTILNLVALAWFGMWMGMTSKNNNLATLKTLLFVQIIPWFGISVASGLLTLLVLMPTFMNIRSTGSGRAVATTAFATSVGLWFPLLGVGLSTLMSVAKDAGFIVWARNRLDSSFREQATKGVGFIPMIPRQPVPPPLPAPPVIVANP